VLLVNISHILCFVESEWAENNRAILDHEYLEISDDEDANGRGGRGSPVFNLGPSLMDEMESMLRTFGSPEPTPLPQERRKPPPPFQLPPGASNATPPASPLAEAINVRNELKEMAAKVCKFLMPKPKCIVYYSSQKRSFRLL